MSGVFVRIPQDLIDRIASSAKHQGRSFHEEMRVTLSARYCPKLEKEEAA